MKKKPFVYLLLAAFCSLTSLKCGDKDEDPSADIALLYGKWNLVSHESVRILTYGTFPNPGGNRRDSTVIHPFKHPIPDTLYWEFLSEGDFRSNDPYVRDLYLLPGGYTNGDWQGEDSVFSGRDRFVFPNQATALTPKYKWGLKMDKVYLSRNPSVLFEIEKLNADSLILAFEQKDPLTALYRPCLRFARMK